MPVRMHVHTHTHNKQIDVIFRNRLAGWRDGSAVKSTDCSSEGPKFKSQQPHGGSQPSVMRTDASWTATVYLDITINKIFKKYSGKNTIENH